MPRQKAMRLLCVYITQRANFQPEDILTVDVKNAFLQSPMIGKEPVLVYAPRRRPGYFGPTGMAELCQALYGTQEAGKCWEVHFQKVCMQQLGFAQSDAQDSVYIRYKAVDNKRVVDAVVYAHVDDGAIFSGATSAKDVAAEIKKCVELKNEAEIPKRFCGLDFNVNERGIFIGQPHLAVTLDTAKDKAPTRHEPLPLNAMDKFIEHSKQLCVDKHSLYRSKLGSLMFLQHTRPDLSYSMSFHGRSSHAPTLNDMNLLEGTCLFAAQTAECGLYYPSPVALRDGHKPGFATLGNGLTADYHNGNGTPKGQRWECYVDTSFRDKGCQTGILVLLNGMVVDMRSCGQKVQARSTTKAELNALFEMIDTVFINQWTWRELLMDASTDSETFIYCDALNVVNAVNNDHPKYHENYTRVYVNKIRRLIGKCLLQEAAGNSALSYLPEMSAQAVKKMKKDIDRETVTAARLLTTVHDELKSYNLSNIAIVHIPGEQNMADHLTKPTRVHETFKNNIIYSLADVVSAKKPQQTEDPHSKA